MAQAVMSAVNESKTRVPEWVYLFSDEQFILWCKQHKLQICGEARSFPDDERSAIFRYAVRQKLVN